MTRPCRCRRIHCSPDPRLFKPKGIPLHDLVEVVIGLDELEAVRLADYEGLYQEDAAREMNISRQTFGNIVGRARRKIADALLNSKALRVSGGPVESCREKAGQEAKGESK